MPTLRDKDSGRVLGTVSAEELQWLVDELEETSDGDTDYWIDADTIEMLEEDGAPQSLIGLLRDCLGTKDGMEIEWS